MSITPKRELPADRPEDSGPIWLFARVMCPGDRQVELAVNFADALGSAPHSTPRLLVEVFDVNPNRTPDDPLYFRDLHYRTYVITGEELALALSEMIPRSDEEWRP